MRTRGGSQASNLQLSVRSFVNFDLPWNRNGSTATDSGRLPSLRPKHDVRRRLNLLNRAKKPTNVVFEWLSEKVQF